MREAKRVGNTERGLERSIITSIIIIDNHLITLNAIITNVSYSSSPITLNKLPTYGAGRDNHLASCAASVAVMFDDDQGVGWRTQVEV